MGNKKGRPKKEDNKVFGYRLRLTKDEYERLDNLSKKTGETKFDLLLEGFKMVEKLKKNSIERRLIGYPKNTKNKKIFKNYAKNLTFDRILRDF